MMSGVLKLVLRQRTSYLIGCKSFLLFEEMLALMNILQNK
jgi:hypothetical protein